MKYILTLILIISAVPLFPGQLDDLEKEMQKERTETPSEESSYSEESDDSCLSQACSGCISELCAEATFYGLAALVYGGHNSHERIQPDALSPRLPGDFMTPFFSLSGNYQYIGEGFYSVNGRAEAGYGFIGLSFDMISFFDNTSEETLQKGVVQLLYRTQYEEKVAIDLGLGVGKTTGKSQTVSGEVSLPVKIRFNSTWGTVITSQLTITEATTLYTIEGKALYFIPFGTIEAGYRFYGNENVAIHGPFAGVSLYY